MPARACVSAVARHVLAQRIGMEGLVPARMAQERTIAAAGVELYASPRWTDAAWRADRAWRQKAALERRHAEAVKRRAAKVEAEWRALQDAVVAAGRPIVALYAVLDGTALRVRHAERPRQHRSRAAVQVRRGGPADRAYAQAAPDRHSPAADRGGPACLRPAERDDVAGRTAGRVMTTITVIEIDSPVHVPE